MTQAIRVVCAAGVVRAVVSVTVLGSVVVGSLILPGCGGEKYPPTSWGMYLNKCARCHEPDGSSATASDLTDHPIDMRSSFFQTNVSDAEIRRIMTQGEGRMQGVSGLSDADVDSILLQVRRFATPGASALDFLPPES
jgi:cytochrome c553